jgi:hypothetical protein
MRSSPLQNVGVGRCRQPNVPNMGEFQRGITPSQAIDDMFIEVLIHQERDHGINPFARARASSSSLVT